jgi:hypothetical protein
MSDTLAEGQKLVRGESLASSNGAYTLTLQDDGNLVLASRGQPLWATSTTGQDVVRAEVQRDGNFVLYTTDKPVWHTDTKGKKNVRLVLQDDRNLVLYAADGPAWSTPRRRRSPRPPRNQPPPTGPLWKPPLSRKLPRNPPDGLTPSSPATPCGPSRSASTATATNIR